MRYHCYAMGQGQGQGVFMVVQDMLCTPLWSLTHYPLPALVTLYYQFVMTYAGLHAHPLDFKS